MNDNGIHMMDIYLRVIVESLRRVSGDMEFK